MIGRPPRALLAALALACAPAVTVRPASSGGPTVFRVEADAREVILSGSMTGWRGVPLEHRGGAFELSLDLAPGRYEYRLEVRGGRGTWLVHPRGAEHVDDGFGGENLVLRIP